MLHLLVAMASAQNYQYELKWQSIDETTAAITGIYWQQLNWNLDDPTPIQTDVNIPSTVETDGHVFTVTAIAANAFANKEWITSINMPSTIRTIGTSAFAFCEDLVTCHIPEGVVEMDNQAFLNCGKLTTVSIPSTLSVIPDRTFAGCSALSQVNIAPGVQVINTSAFLNCTSLTEVPLPEGLLEIQYGAFSDCTSLERVLIPSTVEVLGTGAWTNAFIGCSNLKAIMVHPNNPYFDSRDNCNAIIDTEYQTLITGCSTTTFPQEGIYCIGNSAFYKCKGLQSVVLPDGVRVIEGAAFKGCEDLQEVVLPRYLSEIGAQAFMDCTSLTSFEVPWGVQETASEMLYGCTSLRTLYLPENLTKFNNDYDLPALTDLYCFRSQPPTAKPSYLSQIAKHTTLHVYSNYLSAYKQDSYWKEFFKIVAITDDEVGVHSLPTTAAPAASETFTLDGRAISTPRKGIHIIRRADGPAQKILVK